MISLAKPEYAEITYTFNGKMQKAITDDIRSIPLIYVKIPEKGYSIHVVYYDSEGNIYE